MRSRIQYVKVKKLVLNVRVGESGERSVRGEKALQQAERRIQSHRVSEVREERKISRYAEISRSLHGKEVIDTADDREDRKDRGTPVAVLMSNGGCAVESQ